MEDQHQPSRPPEPAAGRDGVQGAQTVEEVTDPDDFITDYGADGSTYLLVGAGWTLLCMLVFLMFDPSAPPKHQGKDVWAPFRPVVTGTFPPQVIGMLIAGLLARFRPKLGLLSCGVALVVLLGAQVAVRLWTPAIFASTFYWITLTGQVLLLAVAAWASRPWRYHRRRG